MKKILGLDLGAASIGWALIEENESNQTTIIALGSRIIPYNGTEGQDFAKGTGESRNVLRTKARTARKGYDRYQLRRKYLIDILTKNNMMPDDGLMKAPKMYLWKLRSKAVAENVSRKELGRLLLWLNQKRGYKSSRTDANSSKKDTDYVKEVKSRYDNIKSLNFTIGQYFYHELLRNEYFRVKENIFPREAYMEEFDAICSRQKEHLDLSEELISKIRNEIIYYQRPLKSQKGLVSVCEFEGFRIQKDGKEYFVGPKVAPKSSPLFQVAKLWESINNIKLSHRDGRDVELTLDEKKQLFYFLDSHEKLTSTELFKILKKSKKEYTVGKQLEKGLQGNVTKAAIIKVLGDNHKYDDLLHFSWKIVESDSPCYLYSKETGEVLGENNLKYIDSAVEKESFYQLWHTIYSIHDMEECSAALQKRFDIDQETADKLAALDFSKYGFGNKSAKVIRKILPYLIEGHKYSDAMCYAGYNHSSSLTNKENFERRLLDRLKPIEKNSLRQPIVEKILNQMVHVVNAIIDKYGKPDEIRIELARELKQSKEERNDAEKAMAKRQRENKQIEERLEELGLPTTRNNILKGRLYGELEKCNATCIYCGKQISYTEAMRGEEVDIEHIIPKSKLFDDSQSNKTLAHRRCNSDKNDMTAYDFMKSKSKEEFEGYLQKVNKLFEEKVISKAKRDKLLMTEDAIPHDFIDRQLRESQYIARKAKEILQTVCYHVLCTSGTVTAELRHLWGWDDVIMNLQLPKYRDLELTKNVEWNSDHGKNLHSKEVIKDWDKRKDHRHHAVDALVIACTKRGFIKRFNTLSSSEIRADMLQEIEKCSDQYREKLSLLEKYIVSQRPIATVDVERAVAGILVSFKSGKKVAVIGKRKTGMRGNKKAVQTGIIVPRGALSEESVYGKIKLIEKDPKPLKYLFAHPDLIINPKIKLLVEQRLDELQGDVTKAVDSLKKHPILIDGIQKLEHGICYKEEVVIRYAVNTSFDKTEKVIDGKIKQILQTRLDKFGNKHQEAFKDVYKDGKSIKWYEDEGLKRPILSVRCLTGLSAVVPVRKDEHNKEIGFVKPGNNHHIAIYQDRDGNFEEHICSFWNAVERKKYGLQIVIKDTNEMWDKINSAQENTYPSNFLEQLPSPHLELKLSMQQNEMFVLGLTKDEIEQALINHDYKLISGHLYRIQKLSKSNYWFRHHLETQIEDNADSKKSKRYFNVQSLKALFALNPQKVRVDYLGNIIRSQND